MNLERKIEEGNLGKHFKQALDKIEEEGIRTDGLTPEFWRRAKKLYSDHESVNTALAGNPDESSRKAAEVELGNLVINATLNYARWDVESTIDELTGLRNRRAYNRELESVLKANAGDSQRPGDEELYRDGILALYIDLDNFKQVNDTYGHERGDEVLVEVADTILEVNPRRDESFRWGGDEFTLLLKGGLYRMERTYEELQEALKQIRVPGTDFKVESMGRFDIPPGTDYNSAREMVAKAEQDMYLEKSKGR